MGYERWRLWISVGGDGAGRDPRLFASVQTVQNGHLQDAICRIIRSSLWSCSFVDLGDNDNNNDDDNDDEEDNEEAPPLLAVAAAGFLNGSTNLVVPLYNVVVNLLALLLNVGNKRLLLLDNLVEVLEQLSKLNHLTLDILDSFVALLDVA